ncbi:DUF5326 family protein [Streptomyces yaizuensis]|uniref:DUF5326 family protein n=1 Tax=Streptomyces yaizuensis TaxID=2989713 RepID=A0ABQ5P2F5_9ACTN|nr:DUF5326 family protein [Streptomyces sp. YSPA8]GLF96792.1 DUF5326 family protein [Streptomyces sp. YSPA8]
MSVRERFAGLPWWVKWVVLPLLLLAVFGGLIANVVGFVIALLFRALILVAFIAGIVYVVRKFIPASNSRKEW